MTIELLLTIAKIAGIVLGSLLGFILLLIVLVLFVPIRYRVHLSREDDLTAYGNASWLLRVISVTYRYDTGDGGFVRTIRFLGIPVRRREKRSSTDEHSGRAIRWEEDHASFHEPEVDAQDLSSSIQEEPRLSDRKILSEQPSLNEHANTGEQGSKGRKAGIKDRVTDVIGKLKGIRRFLQDESFQRALSLCKKQLVRAWRAFRPRKIRGYVRFGFEDPALTGRILGVACTFYAFYGDSLRVIPAFDEQVIEGRLDVKGHIRVITVILIALKLYFDKDIRRLWAMISKEE
ncbi:MAG: DUF2953 domain-containing protein [Lachnospiraceae bacterium]|jgi:hypothetical protein|nr:DUF2953 domain-containing protein [Lachnospiraceae bacterium]